MERFYRRSVLCPKGRPFPNCHGISPSDPKVSATTKTTGTYPFPVLNHLSDITSIPLVHLDSLLSAKSFPHRTPSQKAGKAQSSGGELDRLFEISVRLLIAEVISERNG